MFITCRHSLEICEGDETLRLPAGYIGDLPEWVQDHWFVRAALSDGTITAVQSTTEAPTKSARASRIIKED